MLALFLPTLFAAQASGPWDRIGPWNIFNSKDPFKGESGTLACAASPATNPDVIYAGGQNNGVSSGIIKTTDGGKHWLRKSSGLYDTRICGVWVHPDDPKGNHVFAGTHSGIYESFDGAESWSFRKETAGWGQVMSFRQGIIQGQPYLLANGADAGILTMPLAGGTWSKIKAPGGIANNHHLSIAVHDGTTDVVTCIGGWGGGQLWRATLDSPTNATWSGPVKLQNHTYKQWDLFPGSSAIWGRCKAPTDCDDDVHPLGAFGDLASCQAAVNATARTVAVSSYTYQHNVSGLGDFAGHCYAISTFAFDPQPQADVDSGRAPGFFPGGAIDCSNAAVDPHDRHHLLFSKGGQFHAYETKDGGLTVREFTHSSAFFVMIDSEGWFYTATQSGAFVSTDGGDHWEALHVFMQSDFPSAGRVIDRVPHDYQRIVPDFRTDQVAIPSDQGLHIVNRSAVRGGKYNLTIATGDMRNTMALSALLAPNAAGSRNLVVNLWDWNVAASWDDGATWTGWADGEASPGYCGEGGGGQGLGKSGYMVMMHHAWIAVSADGGHNWYLLKTVDFGQNWTWAPLPAHLQAGGLAVDPTSPHSLFALTDSCLAHSDDLGASWSDCWTADGLSGAFSQLLVKDKTTMFMMRKGAVPLRTTDGGRTWHELASAAPLFAHGATFSGSLSWSGQTLVLSGGDLSAIDRAEYGTAVWKSTNDGDDWQDETGDLVTISPGPGVWYDKDFYFVTRGEGVTVKRGFEA